jgi:hypothetical protein
VKHECKITQFEACAIGDVYRRSGGENSVARFTQQDVCIAQVDGVVPLPVTLYRNELQMPGRYARTTPEFQDDIVSGLAANVNEVFLQRQLFPPAISISDLYLVTSIHLPSLLMQDHA